MQFLKVNSSLQIRRIIVFKINMKNHNFNPNKRTSDSLSRQCPNMYDEFATLTQAPYYRIYTLRDLNSTTSSEFSEISYSFCAGRVNTEKLYVFSLSFPVKVTPYSEPQLTLYLDTKITDGCLFSVEIKTHSCL